MKGYALSEKHVQRQTFAKILRNLYKMDNFGDKFMEVVSELSRDKIVVVRIALAISLREIAEES